MCSPETNFGKKRREPFVIALRLCLAEWRRRHPREQTMAYDQYAVIKVRDVEPEVFWIVWMDSELPINSFIKTSQNLTEEEVRAELKKMAINETGIDALIKRARENPR
jgi:hypothetical protein